MDAFANILITGGAGFVGSNLALLLKQARPARSVVAFDSLKRRGSELNLPRLRAHGVQFVHGDVRCAEDFDTLPPFDLLIDCAAEPSVQAGMSGSPLYVLNSNLTGTIHCLEAAKRHNAAVLFLSTSRVYPMAPLNALPFEETETRFRWTATTNQPGHSPNGITESFPLEGARSFYGASKLSCELLLQEYAATGMPALINRCGILAGPWQMGKVDQGVITLWVARHIYQQPLRYTGFGGHGKQVRDLLHIEDLFSLLERQMQDLARWNGRVYNVGGGTEVSTSLCELTEHCQAVTGNRVPISSQPETSAVDLRIYLTDSTRVRNEFDWRPRKSTRDIVTDIGRWIVEHQETLRPILS